MNSGEYLTGMRLDKWLWAARFFKTRSSAVAAITGGKVRVDGQRVRPAREVRTGMEVRVHTEAGERTVIVRALNTQRRPAKEAMLLYEETEESRQRREAEAATRRNTAGERPRGTGRPTKRQRRQIRRFTNGGA